MQHSTQQVNSTKDENVVMWAQKVDYAQQQPNTQSQKEEHQQQRHSIELPHKAVDGENSLMASSKDRQGSHRHGQTAITIHGAHVRGQSGNRKASQGEVLNQTQIVKNSDKNAEVRINLRQNLHTNARSGGTGQPQTKQQKIDNFHQILYDQKHHLQKQQYAPNDHYNGHKSQQDVQLQLKDNAYQVNLQSDLKPEIQGLYQTQKVGGISQAQNPAKGYVHHDSGKLNQKEDASYLNQLDGRNSSEMSQDSGNNQHASSQGSEQHKGSTHSTTRKRIQPPQPRNREESNSHRRTQALTNQGHQRQQSNANDHNQQHAVQKQRTDNASRDSSQQEHQAQNSDGGQADESKFSQIVCQVPQQQTQHQQPAGQHQQRHAPVEEMGHGIYLLGPQRRSEEGRKTLVLDLDETLVHSSFKTVENPDITLPVEIENQICMIYVLVRPFVAQFLKRMHKHYELVVFTASLSKYAEPLMQVLDPEGMCVYKLFREHCTYYNNTFVKDLTRLGRNMKDVIIVDNSPVAYLFQPENAIPAVNWYDDPHDTELPRIATILERLAYEDDVRRVIRTIISNNKIDPRQEQLYLSSSSQKHRRDQSQRVDRRRPQNQGLVLNVDNDFQQQQSMRNTDLNDRANRSANSQQRQMANTHGDSESSQRKQSSSKPQSRVRGAPTASQSVSTSHQRHSAKEHAQSSAAQQPHVSSTTNAFHRHQQPKSNQSHARYESSDYRQKQVALIQEQLRQKKLGHEGNPDVEVILQQVVPQQDSSQKQADDSQMEDAHQQKQRSSQNNVSHSSNDIKTAYEHHKMILQLKNEIAVLKSQQNGASESIDKQGSRGTVKQAKSSQQAMSNADKDESKRLVKLPREKRDKDGIDQQRSNLNQTQEIKLANYSGLRSVQNSSSQAGMQNASSNKLSNPTQSQVNQKIVKLIKNKNPPQSSVPGYSKLQAQAAKAEKQNEDPQMYHQSKHGYSSGANQKAPQNQKDFIQTISSNDVVYNQQANEKVKQNGERQQKQHPASTRNQASKQNSFQFGNIAANLQKQLNISANQAQRAGQGNSRGSESTKQSRSTAQSYATHSGHGHKTSSSNNKDQQNGYSYHGGQHERQSRPSSSKYQASGAHGQSSRDNHSYHTSKHAINTQSNAGRNAISGMSTSINFVQPGHVSTKRSSSVKNNSSSHMHQKGAESHHGQGERGNSNSQMYQGSNSNGYGTLAFGPSAAGPGGSNPKKERGHSAGPSSHHMQNGHPQLMVQGAHGNPRSSSTTTRNKKQTSTGGNFTNLLQSSGSHTTKANSNQTLQHNAMISNSPLLGGHHHYAGSSSHHPGQSKGTNATSASDRQAHTSHSHHSAGHHHHQRGSHKSKSTSKNYSNATAQSQLIKDSDQQEGKQKGQQQLIQFHPDSYRGDFLQQQAAYMQQQMHQPSNMHSNLNQTQRVNPQSVGNFNFNMNSSQLKHNGGQISQSQTPNAQGQAAVKQSLKDLQLHDILKLTQQQASLNNSQYIAALDQIGVTVGSTRHAGTTKNQHSNKNSSSGIGANSLTDDFLKKIKIQHENIKQQQSALSGSGPKMNDSELLRHQLGQLGLSINSPKYGTVGSTGNVQPNTVTNASGKDPKAILADIMNMSALQREVNMRQQHAQNQQSDPRQDASQRVYQKQHSHGEHQTRHEGKNDRQSKDRGERYDSRSNRHQDGMRHEKEQRGSSNAHGEKVKSHAMSSGSQAKKTRGSTSSNYSKQHGSRREGERASSHHGGHVRESSHGMQGKQSSGKPDKGMQDHQRADNHSRGSHQSAHHRGVSGNGSKHADHKQHLNQTMRIQSNNNGNVSLGYPSHGAMTSTNAQQKQPQTAANLFLQTHNPDPLLQTSYMSGGLNQYFNSGSASTHGGGVINLGPHSTTSAAGPNQLRNSHHSRHQGGQDHH